VSGDTFISRDPGADFLVVWFQSIIMIFSYVNCGSDAIILSAARCDIFSISPELAGFKRETVARRACIFQPVTVVEYQEPRQQFLSCNRQLG